MRTSTIVAILLLAAPGATQIRWAASLDAALESARAENKVVFIALNMDGERANDQMVEDHYKDPVLVKLSEHTINLFCSASRHRDGGCPRCAGTTCDAHTAADRDVRRRVLGVDGDKPVVAPQHLFVGADGKILNSVAYFVTKGELEWMWVEAIRQTKPDFPWEGSGRSRAPERLKKGSADKATADVPPTKEEVEKALEAMKKVGTGGRGGGNGGGFGDPWRKMFEDIQKNAQVIIRSDDKRALDWGRNSLRSYERFRNGTIRDIGKKSPKAWARVVEEWLGDRDDETRLTAVIAVERLADPKSLAVLQKHARAEKDELIAGRFLRAMAACAPTHRAAIAAVGTALKKNKSEVTRAHAVVAAGKLEDRKAVTELLHAALQDDASTVRAVAAYAIAIRQDEAMLDALQVSMTAESDEMAKGWMEKALAAVKSGDVAPFQDFLAAVLDGEEAASGSEWMERARKWLEEQEKDKGDEPKKGEGEGEPGKDG